MNDLQKQLFVGGAIAFLAVQLALYVADKVISNTGRAV